jgi:O-antigen/teichoic acid export membrane protein
MNEPAVTLTSPPDPTEEAPYEAERIEERIALDGGRTLRQHAARGVIINSFFQVGFALLGMVKRVGVAAFLTTSEFGFWGILLTTVITLSWLKQIGINDKYVQQNERDQEAAFQKAFTLELAYTLVFYVLVVIALPLYSLAYGRPGIMVPGLVLSLAFLATALQTPIWIAYRQMRFVHQRSLEAIDPVVSTVVTIGLAVAGFGYWSLVIGAIAGSFGSAAAALLWSPYRLAWRFDRSALREYFAFSWPLFASGAAGIAVVQGSMLVGNYTVGLAGLGALALATSFATFADRVDDVIRHTLYPAVCAVRDRTDLMFEAFEKSNRLALMWGLPFGVGLALFAPDLVSFVLGPRWHVAQGLMQAFGLIIGFRQVAFNWTVFMRAVGQTKPIAMSAWLAAITFAVVIAPLMLTLGLTGYAIGMAVALVADLVLRGYFLGRLFKGFNLLRHAGRAVAPSIPAVAAVLGVRLLSSGVQRTPGIALAELALYAAVTVAATWAFERPLLGEVLSYLKRAPRPVPTG